MSESNWHFSLCIRKKDEGIKPKLKQEGIESTIFFLKLVWLKSSKRYTTGMPRGVYFPLHNSFKPPFFFIFFFHKHNIRDLRISQTNLNLLQINNGIEGKL